MAKMILCPWEGSGRQDRGVADCGSGDPNRTCNVRRKKKRRCEPRVRTRTGETERNCEAYIRASHGHEGATRTRTKRNGKSRERDWPPIDPEQTKASARSSPPDQQDRIHEKKRRVGSCEWFFDAQFNQWKENEKGVFWVYGNGAWGLRLTTRMVSYRSSEAGAGKSVLR